MSDSPNTKLRAWEMSKAGRLNNLKLVTLEIPNVSNDHVLIKVKSIGLNFADIFAMLGIYSATPGGSFIPGLEFSGVIEECGSNVKKYKPGDKVMGVTRFGAYTTHLVQHPNYLVALPAGWSFEEGASYLVQGITAYYALFSLGNLQKGHKVLIHSAAGGVGILANRFAKGAGALTTGTIGASAKRKMLEEEGFDEIIVRDEHFFEKLATSAQNRPFDLILECIGGKVLDKGYEALAPQGRMIVYGSAHFAETGNRLNPFKLAIKFLRRPKIDPLKLISDNKSVMGFNLIWLYEKKELLAETLCQMEKHPVGRPRVGHIYSFDNMREAISLFQSGKTTGKVVINISQ